MKRRFFIIFAVVVVIVTMGLIFLFNNLQESADSNKPNPTDIVNETDKVIGDPDHAEVIVYEYADYGCSHCADWNTVMDELLEKYDGKLVLVFRGYNLGFQNGLAAAKAATAADLQGYWQSYKNLLFANQAEWIYADADDAESIFAEYFKTASNGAGDVAQFKSDMKSDAVLAQLVYEQSMGDQIKLTGTPTFRIGGKKVNPNNLVSTVEELMNKK